MAEKALLGCRVESERRDCDGGPCGSAFFFLFLSKLMWLCLSMGSPRPGLAAPWEQRCLTSLGRVSGAVVGRIRPR